jgi:hypothetical protein
LLSLLFDDVKLFDYTILTPARKLLTLLVSSFFYKLDYSNKIKFKDFFFATFSSFLSTFIGLLKRFESISSVPSQKIFHFICNMVKNHVFTKDNLLFKTWQFLVKSGKFEKNPLIKIISESELGNESMHSLIKNSDYDEEEKILVLSIMNEIGVRSEDNTQEIIKKLRKNLENNDEIQKQKGNIF